MEHVFILKKLHSLNVKCHSQQVTYDDGTSAGITGIFSRTRLASEDTRTCMHVTHTHLPHTVILACAFRLHATDCRHTPVLWTVFAIIGQATTAI